MSKSVNLTIKSLVPEIKITINQGNCLCDENLTEKMKEIMASLTAEAITNMKTDLL